MTMIPTVSAGKRRVGMSSLSGITAEARRGTRSRSRRTGRARAPPSIAYTRRPSAAPPRPWRGVRMSGSERQRRVRGSKSSTAAMVVPPGCSSSPPNTTMRPSRSRTAAMPPRAVRRGGSCLPGAPLRVVALGRREVGAVAPGQHVEAPPAGHAGGVVARRAGEARAVRPAIAAEAVDLQRAQRAGLVGAARHVEALAYHGGGVGGPRDAWMRPAASSGRAPGS